MKGTVSTSPYANFQHDQRPWRPAVARFVLRRLLVSKTFLGFARSRDLDREEARHCWVSRGPAAASGGELRPEL